jgi:hypothetical protein
VATRNPARALAPWDTAGGAGYQDPRLRALTFAILAPNPHNRQPWMVRLDGADGLTLFCDPERLLPETDPFSRQIVIGLGCFLELLRMAALETGHVAEIAPFPDGMPADHLDDRPIARVRFRRDASATRDPLFAHVLVRRSYKEPFDIARSVAEATLNGLVAQAAPHLMVDITNDRSVVDSLRDLAWRAHLVEMETPRTLMESVDLMRIGKGEIEAAPDGIDLGGPMLEALNLAGVLTRETLADPNSTAYAQGTEMYREIIGTAMGFVWVVSPANARTDQLAAGRDWVRLNMAAAGLGLGLHPLSQALQEYAEMEALYAELHKKLGIVAPARLQMFGRVGYGAPVGPSPRWPVESRLIEA